MSSKQKYEEALREHETAMEGYNAALAEIEEHERYGYGTAGARMQLREPEKPEKNDFEDD